MYDTNQIVNALYDGSVLSALVFGYSMLSKKVLKVKTVDLNKLDLEDWLKLAVLVSGSVWSRDMLVKQGLLPPNIIKN